MRIDRRILAAGAFQLAFVAGVAALKAATNALLVGRAGEQALPWLYVGTAACTLALAAVAARRKGRQSRPGDLALAWLPALLVLAWAVERGAPFAVNALYLAAEVYATSVSLAYWGAIGDLFDPRESRRVFGILGACGMAGSMLGGFAARYVGQHAGALALVPGAAATLVVCWLCARRLRAPERAPVRVRLGPPRAERDAWSYLRRDGFPRLLSLLAVLLSVGAAGVDYVFRARAHAALPEGALAALFGDLSIVIGAFSLVFQLFLTGPLLRRFGIFGYLLTAPVLGVGAAVACAVSPELWPAFVLKAVEQAGALSINQTGLQLLYNPMPDAVRPAARAAIDGFFKKAGTALGGLVLLAVVGVPDRFLAAGIAALAAFCGVLVIQLRLHYVRAIRERLVAPGGDAHARLALLEGTARRALVRVLDAPDAGEREVLTAIELVARDPHIDLGPHLATLLAHGSERVREAAARLGVRARDVDDVARARLLEMARSDARRPREAAILALPTVSPALAASELPPLLDDPDPGVRCATIAALWAGGTAAPRAHLEALLARGRNANVVERREVAKLLGRIVARALAPRLAPYLADVDDGVRRSACQAAGALQAPELVEPLLAALGGRGARREATEALVAYGDALVPELERLLDDRTQRFELRLRLPRVLARIGTAAAAHALLFSNPRDDAALRVRIADALVRLCAKHPELPLDARRLHQAAERHLGYYRGDIAAYRALAPALEENALVLRLLREHLDQELHIAFRLLGISGGDAAGAARLHARYVAGPERERALAAELAEHLAPKSAESIRGSLARYHRAPDPDPPKTASVEDVLLEQSASRDPLLATVARLTAESRGLKVPGEPELETALIERIFSLQGARLFAHCTVDDLGALAPLAHELRFTAGEIVYREGDPGDALYVILEGEIAIGKQGRVLLSLGPKESFGETSLLDGKPRPATATATLPSRLIAIERAELMDLIADRSEILRGIFASLASHLRDVLDAAAGDQPAGEKAA